MLLVYLENLWLLERKNFMKYDKKLKEFMADEISKKDLEKATKMSVNLKGQGNNLQLIIDMVSDVLAKKFHIDAGDLALLIGTIIYVISPFDAIPDLIPVIGWLDDIVVVAWVMKHSHTIFTTYKITKTIINTQVDNIINDKVLDWIDAVKIIIKKQYKSFFKQILIESLFFSVLVGVYYFYPIFPVQIIVYSFIGVRLALGLGYGIYRVGNTLLNTQFFKVSKLGTFLIDTKNINKSIRLDMQNFYEHYYQKLVHKSVQITHNVSSAVQIVPSNQDIFDRLYNTLILNTNKFLQARLILLFLVFILYSGAIQLIRWITFNHI